MPHQYKMSGYNLTYPTTCVEIALVYHTNERMNQTTTYPSPTPVTPLVSSVNINRSRPPINPAIKISPTTTYILIGVSVILILSAMSAPLIAVNVVDTITKDMKIMASVFIATVELVIILCVWFCCKIHNK